MANELRLRLALRRGDFSLSVDLTLPGSGVSAIFGPSGCGKTSLLRAIAGLERAEGMIEVDGECWQNGRYRLPTHQRALGMVFQHSALLPHLDVEGNLRFGWRRAGGDPELLQRWIDRLDLGPLLLRRVQSLSGGERQRVGLARALVTAPRLLLLDEPLSALDGQRRAEILPYLARLRHEAGMPILLVSHAADEVARLADYLVLLREGRVVADGPALQLLQRDDLPLALEDDAAAVLEGTIQGRGPDGLYSVQVGPAQFHTYGASGHTAGETVRLRIPAREVSLTLSCHQDSSILNIVPVRLQTLRGLADPGQVQATLALGEQTLFARVSTRSAARLGLHEGMMLWAQIKAVAVLV
ncbi:molybdenum ABC transporter ATP-binding protein [Chitinimonas lacunae]|uniref:Molybdenum ABC transporter ATP-binding protein n=1 Tax=Chitinimonas lacunae TaxID=1963018 RepID=A0ABV8MLP4_9NEIS